MNAPPDEQSSPEPRADRAGPESPETAQAQTRPREIGGLDGPEPTRFGDWEKGGRCIDF
jgi:hypothetical protein